ncbi:hypothetical protein M011DRAFT_135523 [Sporormia fimetaria CBS 119925]|uniref:RRM domain-containing protein n=1 Tax=Sporormia fimetaria CBS 119925 TaxID=1340428 RepID=A0A6A6V6S2_9PLEO|nr:hypothetical protein M011DRAFT_135523 [Sporormia fimetaria CBS 119925]
MARGVPFPTEIDDFDSDERITFSRIDNTYILEDEEGKQWEFNQAAGRWFQPATEEERRAYEAAFGGPADEAQSAEPTRAQVQKKRKAAAPAEPESKKPKVVENRAVYVTDLPPDTTREELEREFGKWGVIDVSDDGSKRVKMYADSRGNFNGEALVIYFKKESVQSAIRMMDDSWFRPGQPNIHVKEADMSYKKIRDGEEVKQTLTRQQRKAMAENRAELSRKLADWSDDEDPQEAAPVMNQWAKFVIVKHAFTLDELEEDKDAAGDIQEDMREDGEKYGTVTNVVIYDLEPEGILTIRFEDTDSAAAFVKANNGRMFAGRALDVKHAQDNPKGKFKKSSRHVDEDEERRLLDSVVADDD